MSTISFAGASGLNSGDEGVGRRPRDTGREGGVRGGEGKELKAERRERSEEGDEDVVAEVSIPVYIRYKQVIKTGLNVPL
ncbi:uncharacterized protein A4U43_C09F4100 [Asparagus officinalis]|uniref:Uncharacterized protein n=1 Tax=Asparagus officinalis TaxID=4686 RepID=A0A5P1E5H2_ASPOF|nr:uncharacterized protein A4U43_C09F4100 [Asparagus officinalis]